MWLKVGLEPLSVLTKKLRTKKLWLKVGLQLFSKLTKKLMDTCHGQRQWGIILSTLDCHSLPWVNAFPACLGLSHQCLLFIP